MPSTPDSRGRSSGAAVKPELLVLGPARPVPNNTLPVLIYRGAGAGEAGVMLDVFARHGWRNGWRNGIYPFGHFHSTAHEVLGIVGGAALVRLGGDAGPKVVLSRGDVLVMPAGTSHERLSDDPGLDVIGAYPGDRACDLIRADAVNGDTFDRAVRTIAALPRPTGDPLFGAEGPLLALWRSR